jgi:LysR family transcriptional regulator, glycine cleavage system transcriptional activator
VLHEGQTRTPLAAEYLKSGDLIEPLPQLRIDSPIAFWLILSPRARSSAQARLKLPL